MSHNCARFFPVAFNSVLFCNFLRSSGSCCRCLSYLFFHLPEILFFLCVQQRSPSWSCYTLTYFSLLLCYFSHCPFPPVLCFQVTSVLHDNFSWKSYGFFSQPSWKCPLSACHCKWWCFENYIFCFHHYDQHPFILPRSCFGSTLHIASYLYSGDPWQNIVSTSTSVAMFIHPCTKPLMITSPVNVATM